MPNIFRTNYSPPESENKIDHSTQIFCMGSCFVETIGDKLRQVKFNVCQNPFGILFHPLAIENALMRIYTKTLYEAHEIASYNEQFFSLDFHSAFSTLNPQTTLNLINEQVENGNQAFVKCKTFILTLGTAWVYKLIDHNVIVANCHKIPNNQFEKILLTEQEIITALTNCLAMINDAHNDAKVILTISPVRHIKDGFVENNLSKARLISAVHTVVSEHKNVNYFGAYELILDDLRDYRFYANDMLHPNQTAIDYVWDHFTKTHFTYDALQLNKKITAALSALNHRSFNTKSVAHKQFMYDLIKKLELLENCLTKDVFHNEIANLKNMLYAD